MYRGEGLEDLPAVQRRGPRGSPCCTPSADKMTLSPQNRDGGKE